jgi:hypothetical protein
VKAIANFLDYINWASRNFEPDVKGVNDLISNTFRWQRFQIVIRGIYNLSA